VNLDVEMTYEKAIDRIGDRPGVGIQQWLARRIVRRFLGDAQSASVLEVGTGVGRIAVEISRLGHNYMGVEPTSSLRVAAQDRLRQIGSSHQVVNSSLPELSGVPDAYYSHALAVHVLEHAPSADMAFEWLRGIARTVVPGGRILIICPNFLDLKGYFFDTDWTHQWVSTTSRIAVLGEEIGLEVVDEFDLQGTFKSSIVRLFLSGIGKIFPTRVANNFFRRFFGLRGIGSGVQTAFFWRMSWVQFKKV